MKLTFMTPIAVRIGAIPWMPKLLPQITATDKFVQRVSKGRVTAPSTSCQPQTCFSVLFATFNKNESCPCLASNDNPTGTPSASAIGSDTCGNRPIPATLVSDNVRG